MPVSFTQHPWYGTGTYCVSAHRVLTSRTGRLSEHLKIHRALYSFRNYAWTGLYTFRAPADGAKSQHESCTQTDQSSA